MFFFDAKASSEISFHLASTKAEKALAYLYTINQKDYDLYNFIMGRTWYKKSSEKKYNPLFTQDFITSVRARDRELALKYCGKECDATKGVQGIDFNPLICEQDVKLEYDFYTVSEDHKKAIVISRLRHEHSSEARNNFYRFIRVNDEWVLDGVKCSFDGNDIFDFNYSG